MDKFIDADADELEAITYGRELAEATEKHLAKMWPARTATAAHMRDIARMALRAALRGTDGK